MGVRFMNDATVTRNLELLSDSNIEFDYKMVGAKMYACVKLKCGRTLRFCPRAGSTLYGNKRYNTKTVKGFISFMNKLNIKNKDNPLKKAA